MVRTTGSSGLKGRPPTFVGCTWVRACCVPNSLSCAVALLCLEGVCCKTMAAFRTSSKTLSELGCPSQRTQTTCLPAELGRTIWYFLTFAANAQWPPCHRASCPTLCLDTMHWHRSPKLFDTPPHLGICANGFLFCLPHGFYKRPGLATWQPHL